MRFGLHLTHPIYVSEPPSTMPQALVGIRPSDTHPPTLMTGLISHLVGLELRLYGDDDYGVPMKFRKM